MHSWWCTVKPRQTSGGEGANGDEAGEANAEEEDEEEEEEEEEDVAEETDEDGGVEATVSSAVAAWAEPMLGLKGR
jgi:hypothetical protein